MRLLEKAINDGTQPKYLLFENVKNLVGKKFKPDFLKFLDILHDFGYRTYWKVIDAKDCGIPQRRERVFVICMREDVKARDYKFPKLFECEMKFSDIVCHKSDMAYHIQDKRLGRFLDELITGDISADRGGKAKPKQSGKASPVKENDLAAEDADKEKKHYEATKLTPKQCFQLMGLAAEDADKCKTLGISDTQMYKQAGNGIVTNCVQLIGEHLYKAVADPSFVCTDERINGIMPVSNSCSKPDRKMLNMDEEARQHITKDMTVSQIRGFKRRWGEEKELQEEAHADTASAEDDSVYVSNGFVMEEFDPNRLGKEYNKDKMYATCQYGEFSKKHGYIPKYFNVKNKKEITDHAMALATSCGSNTGIGSIITFDAAKEVEMIDAKLIQGDTTWEEAKETVCKIWRIAKPEEREKIEKMRLEQKLLLLE